MPKLKFTEKNNLIVKYKNADYFHKDLDLFKKHCSSHPLNNELSKANKFSHSKYDALILGILLDIIDIKEILKNRTQYVVTEQEAENKSDNTDIDNSENLDNTDTDNADNDNTDDKVDYTDTDNSDIIKKEETAEATEDKPTDKKKGQSKKSSQK